MHRPPLPLAAPRLRRRALLMAAVAPPPSPSRPAAPTTVGIHRRGPTRGGEAATAPELRLGYFANVTHAPAIVGVDEGFFADELGDTKLTTQIFNAGPAAVEALFAGALDATYIGPNPAINAFVQSDGEAVRIIAGATSGGAQLVVREGIDGPEDLEGKNIATPQLGNTQDVALRAWLTDKGLENDVAGGGDVTITPTANADTLQLFQAGELDGAWVPEPWASRLVLEAGAEVLVDEKDLWPEGEFVTTHLIVRTEFLEQYPGTVEALLRGHVESVEWIKANEDERQDHRQRRHREARRPRRCRRGARPRLDRAGVHRRPDRLLARRSRPRTPSPPARPRTTSTSRASTTSGC